LVAFSKLQTPPIFLVASLRCIFYIFKYFFIQHLGFKKANNLLIFSTCSSVVLSIHISSFSSTRWHSLNKNSILVNCLETFEGKINFRGTKNRKQAEISNSVCGDKRKLRLCLADSYTVCSTNKEKGNFWYIFLKIRSHKTIFVLTSRMVT
jgi:hypothetical protein